MSLRIRSRSWYPSMYPFGVKREPKTIRGVLDWANDCDESRMTSKSVFTRQSTIKLVTIELSTLKYLTNFLLCQLIEHTHRELFNSHLHDAATFGLGGISGKGFDE